MLENLDYPRLGFLFASFLWTIYAFYGWRTDKYLNSGRILLLGVLQTVTIGWGYYSNNYLNLTEPYDLINTAVITILILTSVVAVWRS